MSIVPNDAFKQGLAQRSLIAGEIAKPRRVRAFGAENRGWYLAVQEISFCWHKRHRGGKSAQQPAAVPWAALVPRPLTAMPSMLVHYSLHYSGLAPSADPFTQPTESVQVLDLKPVGTFLDPFRYEVIEGIVQVNHSSRGWDAPTCKGLPIRPYHAGAKIATLKLGQRISVVGNKRSCGWHETLFEETCWGRAGHDSM
jgi:hypothetical protein